MDVLRLYRPAVRAVLEHVRDREGEPFLFHCTGECPVRHGGERYGRTTR